MTDKRKRRSMSTVIDKPITLPVQLEGEFQILLAKTFSLEPEWLKKKRKDAFDSFVTQAFLPEKMKSINTPM